MDMHTAHEATAETGHDLSRRDILTAGLGLGAAAGLTAFLPGLADVASAAARSSVPPRKQVYVEVSALSSLTISKSVFSTVAEANANRPERCRSKS